MNEVILFLLTFFFVFLLYQIFVVRRAKKNKKVEVLEVSYLVKRYRLDLDKVSYNQLLQIIAIVSSFDITLIVSIILLIKNFYLEIIIGFCSMLVIIMVSYHLVYLFYKKKGMIKNGK